MGISPDVLAFALGVMNIVVWYRTGHFYGEASNLPYRSRTTSHSYMLFLGLSVRLVCAALLLLILHTQVHPRTLSFVIVVSLGTFILGRQSGEMKR